MKPMRMPYSQINLVTPVQMQSPELVIGHFCIDACSLAIRAVLDQLNTDQGAQMRGVAIFAKAFMGIPAQQATKITRPLCLRLPQPSCFFRWAPNKGGPASFSQ